MPRPKTKTEVATIKLSRHVRAAWEAAATSERRSLANMFEVAILAFCEQKGIVVPEPPAEEAPVSPQRAADKTTKRLVKPRKP
jgi:hypothetical protein